MSSFTSFEAISEPVEGEPRRLRKATAHHTIAVFTEGDPLQVVVQVEGSHDGFRWFPMGTVTFGGGDPVAVKSTQPTTHLVTWIRASLIFLEGGADPTVTATIASADDV